ncbi:MAG: hypothetical protein HQK78_17790 [Desulfobacterales bacterium]|nr:hypothetical protein [Desulfobacterales bacterium]
MQYNIKIVNEISQTDAQERLELFRWIAVQSDFVKIEIIRLQTDLSRQKRSEYNQEISNEFYYAVYILAAKMVMHYDKQSKKSNFQEGLKEAEKLSHIRTSNIRMKSKTRKKDIIKIRFYNEIKRLREVEKLSWRKIAEYIKKYHKVTITHGYIQQIYKEEICQVNNPQLFPKKI